MWVMFNIVFWFSSKLQSLRKNGLCVYVWHFFNMNEFSLSNERNYADWYMDRAKDFTVKQLSPYVLVEVPDHV